LRAYNVLLKFRCYYRTLIFGLAGIVLADAVFGVVMFKILHFVFRMVWALPLTLCGLALLMLVLPTRPRVAWLRLGGTQALCAWGGGLAWLLNHHPLGRMYAAAIGHVVIAGDAKMLAHSGAHEFEHVRQAERWGILLPVAYVLEGFWQKSQGREYYRDNRFEVAAYQYGSTRFERRQSPKV
jgi:hypothetical protein